MTVAVMPVTACTTSPAAPPGKPDDMAGMAGPPTTPAIADATSAGDGLSDSAGGYTFVPAGLPAASGSFTFRITGPTGQAVTRYQPYESKLVLAYLVRSDLSDYRLLDPAMRQDGTWWAQVPTLRPGSYRAYVSFAAPDSAQGTPLRYTLSKTLTVSGRGGPDLPLPAATDRTTTDGYTVSWTGLPKAGVPSPLRITITSGGKPVQRFDRFLDGYLHLTAFRAGDLAFARFFSTGKDATPALTANAVFPEAGVWRLFAQFRIGGRPHTAMVTVVVPAS